MVVPGSFAWLWVGFVYAFDTFCFIFGCKVVMVMTCALFRRWDLSRPAIGQTYDESRTLQCAGTDTYQTLSASDLQLGHRFPKLRASLQVNVRLTLGDFVPSARMSSFRHL